MKPTNMQDWKLMMRKLKLDNIKASTPHAFEASGGYDMIIKPYTDKTSLGLSRCVSDYLKFQGHTVTQQSGWQVDAK